MFRLFNNAKVHHKRYSQMIFSSFAFSVGDGDLVTAEVCSVDRLFSYPSELCIYVDDDGSGKPYVLVLTTFSQVA